VVDADARRKDDIHRAWQKRFSRIRTPATPSLAAGRRDRNRPRHTDTAHKDTGAATASDIAAATTTGRPEVIAMSNLLRTKSRIFYSIFLFLGHGFACKSNARSLYSLTLHVRVAYFISSHRASIPKKLNNCRVAALSDVKNRCH
jgi:hypothetical protein